MNLNFALFSADFNSVVYLPKWTALRKRLRLGSERLTGPAYLSGAGRRAVALVAPVAGVLLFVSTTADATVETRPALAAALARPSIDPRIAHLENFFHTYRCPAPLYVTEYLRIADANDLDYRLLPAISIRETQCGVYEKGNNRLGFHPDETSFPSVLAGIEFVGKRLAEHPFYKGKSVEGKLFTYNPVPAYPGEIQWIMRQIEP